jgi:xylan 1,4-beta-xylosidase
MPVLNVFRCSARWRAGAAGEELTGLLDDILARAGGDPDAGVIHATRRRAGILVWHYHDDDVAGPDAAIKLNIKGCGAAFHR